jgi:hypothetical protein
MRPDGSRAAATGLPGVTNAFAAPHLLVDAVGVGQFVLGGEYLYPLSATEPPTVPEEMEGLFTVRLN